MNLSIGPVHTTEKLAEISRRLKTAEDRVNEFVRPTLKGLEKTQWSHLHTKLLTIIMVGPEIANRSTLFCELGKITPAAAWRLAQKLDDHVRDISRALSILNEREGRESLEKELKHIKKESLLLHDEMKELAHFIHQ